MPGRLLPGVVCLHGLGRSESDWDGVRSGLEAYGPVHTPNLPRRPDDALVRADAAIEPGSVVVGHSMGGVLALRLAAEAPRPLRALVLTGCFFPPARNGRSTLESARDYAAHRVAYVRSMGRPGTGEGSRTGSAGALASLVRLALRRGAFDAAAEAVASPVLVVHARDDHHVPLNFALAAATRHPDWEMHVLDEGGRHAHIRRPPAWLDAVAPWLSERY